MRKMLMRRCRREDGAGGAPCEGAIAGKEAAPGRMKSLAICDMPKPASRRVSLAEALKLLLTGD
jgi:hypothetical protein